MADLKISQLPEISVLANTDTLPVVNSGTTSRATVNTISNSLPLTTFVRANSANWGGILSYAQFNYQGPYSGGALYTGDNLINNTDNYLPWDTTAVNTDSNTFELVNPDSANSRIWVKQGGYYEVVSRVIYFDCYSTTGTNMTMSVYLDINSSSSGGTWSRLATLNRNWFSVSQNIPGVPATILVGSVTTAIPAGNRYISLAVRPTQNTPFPDNVSGSTTSIFIRRIGSL